jgi:hypothetical protein
VGWLRIQWGMVTAWAAAFAFEAAIAALTHKLAKHIESTPRYTAGRVWLRRISYQYLNAYAAGDLVVQLFAQEKRQRILAAAERWPELPAASIAITAGASPGYVSEVLRLSDGRRFARSSDSLHCGSA